jgi:uncharacterized repeat protein (TIGR01451 family)
MHSRRVLSRIGSRRATALISATIAASAALLVTGSTPALAVHDLQMQLDGNTAVDSGGSQPLDWESLFKSDSSAPTPGDIGEKGSLPTGFLARGHVADYALPDTSTYATGSKDTLNIGKIGTTHAGWQCGNSNNLGAKDDLVNVYTTAYRNPANNHLILYFGAEKSSNLGDNNIGIWFLQDATAGCTLQANGHNTDWSGHHAAGDVLLTAAFTNGGTVATVESHVWTAGAANAGEGSLGAAQGGFLCGGPTAETAAGAFACAITNDPTNQPPNGDVNPPWNHPVKTPGTDGVSLASEEFYEGGVDVTQAELNANVPGDPCITTFVADTRSSQSPTATLFDYAAGSFPVCHPATSLNVSRSPATMLSGGTVTWTAVEQNTGTSQLSNVSVTDAAATGACAPFTYVSGDNNNNGKLDTGANNAGESWTFTCSQTLTASKTIHVYGTGTDVISGKIIAGGPAASCTFDDTATPPSVTFQATGYVCDPNERASASVTVVNPSTKLTNTAATVSPDPAHANDNVTFTFFEKNDGDVALTSPGVTTDDANCVNATSTLKTGDTHNVGDANNDGILDIGEEWTFTCTTSFTTAGTKTVTATGHGSVLGVDVTFYQLSNVDCVAGTTNASRLCDTDEVTSKSVLIINPGTALREAVSAVVTFTYSEKNTGDSIITSPSVTSDCAGAGATASPILAAGSTHNVGDTGNDGVFSPGETWKFSCTKTVSLGITDVTDGFTDAATGHGTDSAGSAVPTTNETDGSSVTVTNASPNTQLP